MAPPTKTLLLIALLAAAATTTSCAQLNAESNYSILSKLFNSPQQQVATPQKKRGLFGRKKSTASTKPTEGEGEQTYSTYLTAALGIFLALGTWYLPINNSDDKNKIINNNKKSITIIDNYSTCTESISDLETTIDSSSSDDDDSRCDDNNDQQKRRQLVQQNKPPSGYGNFLSFISEDSSPVVEPNEAEKKIGQVNEIKELMIENEISTEKCNELFKLYDNKLDSLYKNLVRLKEKKIEQ